MNYKLIKSFILVTILLAGCSTQRMEEKHKSNIAAMQKELAEAAQQVVPKKKDPLENSLKLLEEAAPAVEAEKEEDLTTCNLNVHRESPDSFFAMLSQAYDVGIVMDGDIKDPISINLPNVTIKNVMSALKETYGYASERTAYGYRIFKPRMETQIFMINYLDIDRKGETSTSVNPSRSGQRNNRNRGGVGGGQGRNNFQRSGSNVTTSMDSHFWDDLEKTINLLIDVPYVENDKKDDKKKSSDEKSEESKNRPSAVINRNTGIIVIRAYPKEMKKIREYLYRTQSTVKRQVILETKILDVELTDAHASGINWNQLRVMSAGKKSIDLNIGGRDSWNNQNFPNPLGLTLSKAGSFESVVNLLSDQGKVSVLSSPRISVVNNQKAVIKVGTDEFFSSGTSSNTTAGVGGNVTSSSVNLEQFFSGIAMDVTPQISANDEVSLHIHPVVSRVTSVTKTFESDGRTTELPLATTRVRETDTIVTARSEEVIIIGGLMENEVALNNNGLPFNDKTGVIDTLFGTKAANNANRELVILLKPIIVKEDTWAKELKKTMKRSFKA